MLYKLNCLVDHNEVSSFPSDANQSLQSAVLSPLILSPNIQETLQSANFKYHRSCSVINLVQNCHAAEGQTLLMFWGCHRSESKGTMSMSDSSCSSVHIPNQQTPRERELRSIAQQTEISCRQCPVTPVNAFTSESEELRLLRSRIADSVTFSSPASSLMQPTPRSTSILGSVCALLLKKQHSTHDDAKESVSLSGDNICRICFGGESAERLVRPCSCRGTIAAVHRTCLERWLLQAATSYCELCRHHYIVTRSHKWSWMRSLCEWARSGRGRALAADMWRGVALGAASVLGTARALHACDLVLQAGARKGGGAALIANLFSSLLIGIIVFSCVGALNGLLTTWMLLKVQEHQTSWRAWRDSTLHVHVSLSSEISPEISPRDSEVTVVGAPTSDRSTNIADPFMNYSISNELKNNPDTMKTNTCDHGILLCGPLRDDGNVYTDPYAVIKHMEPA